jgi:hypothetical protein
VREHVRGYSRVLEGTRGYSRVGRSVNPPFCASAIQTCTDAYIYSARVHTRASLLCLRASSRPLGSRRSDECVPTRGTVEFRIALVFQLTCTCAKELTARCIDLPTCIAPCTCTPGCIHTYTACRSFSHRLAHSVLPCQTRTSTHTAVGHNATRAIYAHLACCVLDCTVPQRMPCLRPACRNAPLSVSAAVSRAETRTPADSAAVDRDPGAGAAGVSPVVVQVRGRGEARSQCRCGSGESPVPVQMWQGGCKCLNAPAYIINIDLQPTFIQLAGV